LKKLVSSNEAAQLLGLSLQGVHYRIKKGQLESIKQDGKIFVYVDKSSTQIKKQTSSTIEKTQLNDYKQLEEKILQSKDEQIHLLKKTIKFMKKQHNNEINRLDKTQTKMLNVFQSEVDLLKSAFNEMKNIYKLDQKETSSTLDQVTNQDTPTQIQFMDVKDFFIFMRKHNKTDSQIKNIILEKVKSGDKRFIYNKTSKEMIIYESDFLDII